MPDEIAYDVYVRSNDANRAGFIYSKLIDKLSKITPAAPSFDISLPEDQSEKNFPEYRIHLKLKNMVPFYDEYGVGMFLAGFVHSLGRYGAKKEEIFCMNSRHARQH